MFGEFTPLRADFLENDLLGLGSHLGLTVAALHVVFVTANTQVSSERLSFKRRRSHKIET